MRLITSPQANRVWLFHFSPLTMSTLLIAFHRQRPANHRRLPRQREPAGLIDRSFIESQPPERHRESFRSRSLFPSFFSLRLSPESFEIHKTRALQGSGFRFVKERIAAKSGPELWPKLAGSGSSGSFLSQFGAILWKSDSRALLRVKAADDAQNADRWSDPANYRTGRPSFFLKNLNDLAGERDKTEQKS